MAPDRKNSPGDVFTVDNSDQDWKVRHYLHDWTELATKVSVRRSTCLTNVCANVCSAILKDAQSPIKQFAFSLLLDIREETQSCSPQWRPRSRAVGSVLPFHERSGDWQRLLN